MSDVLTNILGTFLGAYGAFFSIAWFIRVTTPKDPPKGWQCAYCGKLVPRHIFEAGIGAVNAYFRRHSENECELHPMRGLKLENRSLHTEFEHMYRIAVTAVQGTDPTLTRDAALALIRDIASPYVSD